MAKEFIAKSEEGWKRQPTPEKYEVCGRKGTERPSPTNLRYCINSVSLKLAKKDLGIFHGLRLH